MATFVRLRAQKTGDWFVHPKLRSKLVKDADRLDTNLTEVAVSILAEKYKLPHEIVGRKTTPAITQDVLNLGDAIWDRLERAIRMEAMRQGRKTWIDQIRHDLCAHYGLVVPTKRSARAA